jgi:hypothetical protein
MKKLYLHIGVHKTGSSSIQESFFRARSELQQQGFHYFCEDYDGKERALPRLWVDSSSFDKVHIKHPDILNEKLHSIKSNKVIVSIEDLSWFIESHNFSSLKIAFKGFDMTVICYIRRQDRQLISYMQEGSKSRHKPSIRYYGKTLNALPINFRSEYLNYEKRYNNWKSAFNCEVTFKTFESVCVEGGDVVLDFADIIGAKNISPIRVNESLGFKKTKLGHLLNSYTFNNSELESFIRNSMDDDKSEKLLPSRKNAKLIYESFKDQNQRLLNIISPNQKILFDDSFSSYEEAGSDEWTEKSTNEVVVNLLKLFDRYVTEQKKK